MSVGSAGALNFSGVEQPSASGGRFRTWLDLLVGYGLILAVIWSPEPLRRVLYFVTLGWIGYATWGSFSSWDAIGVRAGGFFRSVWLVGVALILSLTAVIFAGRMQTLHMPHTALRFVQSFWGYTVWSFFQQFLLQDFVLRRLVRLTNSRRVSVVMAAGLFALAHLPNPVLTAMTLVWGVAACLIFLRYRNLFTLGAAHAILGICVAVTLPSALQHDMRVGLGYLKYRPHERHHRHQMERGVMVAGWMVDRTTMLRLDGRRDIPFARI